MLNLFLILILFIFAGFFAVWIAQEIIDTAEGDKLGKEFCISNGWENYNREFTRTRCYNITNGSLITRQIDEIDNQFYFVWSDY